jgi:regulatory protein
LSKLTERFPDNSDLVGKIIVTLKHQNLQSDQRFAEMLVATRIRRGYGPIRIQAELKSRGVSKNIIELALIESGADWLCLAREVLSKKYGSGSCDQFSDKVKRSSFLQYRGFKSDHILACFK